MAKQWYVDDNDIIFRLGIVKEMNALGIDWLSREGLVYQRLRFWETDGDYGFMAEGLEAMSKHFVGSTPQQIESCLKELQRKGLVYHVQCDQRVYRNKTKVWMSAVRLAGANTAVEAIKVLAHNKKNTATLTEHPLNLKAVEAQTVGTPTETVVTAPTNCGYSTHQTPVTNKNINKKEKECSPYDKTEAEGETENGQKFQSPDGGDFSVGSPVNKAQGGVVKITTPFAEAPVTTVKPKKYSAEQGVALLADELMGMAEGKKAGVQLRSIVKARLKQGYSEADLKLVVKNGKWMMKDKTIFDWLAEWNMDKLLKGGGNGKAPLTRMAQLY